MRDWSGSKQDNECVHMMGEDRVLRVSKVGRRHSLRVEGQWSSTEFQTQYGEQGGGTAAQHGVSDSMRRGVWKGQPTANRFQKGEEGIHAEHTAGNEESFISNGR